MHRLAEFVSRLFGKQAPGARSGECIAVAAEVIASQHEDGVVFLHVGRGEVFEANGVGARIWRGIAAKEPVSAVAAAIAAEFGVEAALVERDAKSFLGDLEAHGFLMRAAGA
ncbi:MAG TPA: PqqD family protein [Bryobacteraceae bacterium]|nr:PqqD family protein [Bryobacteraceae bacterium]